MLLRALKILNMLIYTTTFKSVQPFLKFRHRIIHVRLSVSWCITLKGTSNNVFSTVKRFAILNEFKPVEAVFTDLLRGEGAGRWAYRFDVICEPVLSADELNNGQEPKGLLATVNLWPLCWGKEVDGDREEGAGTLSSAAAWQLWAVRTADLLQISLDVRQQGLSQAAMNALWCSDGWLTASSPSLRPAGSSVPRVPDVLQVFGSQRAPRLNTRDECVWIYLVTNKSLGL